MEIKDSHILITGANRGIGKAISMMCAEDKANLHLVTRTKDEELKKEVLAAGAKSCELYEVDLSQPMAINSFLEQVKDLPIDILVNNAGQLTGGLFETQKMDEVYSMMQVNVNALMHLTNGLLPGMLKRKRGKIVNNSSVSGVIHLPCASTYAASKSAVIAFTNCLKQELAGTGVSTLVLVTPGIETRMYQDIPNRYGKNFDLSMMRKGRSPKKYAQMIREAILEDLSVLKPHGLMGISLFASQLLPTTFEKIVSKKFKR